MKLIDGHSPFARITTFLMDIDGVLTDGGVLALESGELVRRMNIKDGFAIQHAAKSGYRLAVFSGGRGSGVAQRLAGLGVQDVYLGIPTKLPAYEAYLVEHGLRNEEVLYMGDDLPDLAVMQQAGLAAAPADAATDILAMADYVTRAAGGQGCVREVIEKILKARNDWFNDALLDW